MKMKKVVIYVCLTAFFFGTMEVALKVAGGSLDPIQMTFCASSSAGWCWRRWAGPI